MVSRFVSPNPGARRRSRRFVGAACVGTLSLAAILLAVLAASSARGRDGRSGAAPDPNGTRTELATLDAKIQALSEPSSKPPSSLQPIIITESEANTYLRERGPQFLPPAVRDPRLHIVPDRVEGSADVNFDQLNPPNSKQQDMGAQVLASLFKGTQHVTAVGRLETADGQGTVQIESVMIGNTSIPDWLTRMFVESYLKQKYNIDLSKPFPLPDHVAHIVLADGRATFVRGARKRP